jgi:uncharacterized pyridoxamine 5'-phosphate oxidase family protein
MDRNPRSLATVLQVNEDDQDAFKRKKDAFNSEQRLYILNTNTNMAEYYKRIDSLTSINMYHKSIIAEFCSITDVFTRKLQSKNMAISEIQDMFTVGYPILQSYKNKATNPTT